MVVVVVVVEDYDVVVEFDDEPPEEDVDFDPFLIAIVGIRDAADVGRDADTRFAFDCCRGTTLAAVASANVAKTATMMP